MAQDIVARNSRRYRGYRQAEVVDGGGGDGFEDPTSSTFTYDGAGVLQTVTKTRTLVDGTVQTKVLTFTYTTDGNVQTITQEVTTI